MCSFPTPQFRSDSRNRGWSPCGEHLPPPTLRRPSLGIAEKLQRPTVRTRKQRVPRDERGHRFSTASQVSRVRQPNRCPNLDIGSQERASGTTQSIVSDL